jgi:hypothetical protein
MGLLKIEGLFNKSNNLEHLWKRIRAEMEQISTEIIERSVGECQMVGEDNFNICVKFKNN